jgi:hypothetical protein
LKALNPKTMVYYGLPFLGLLFCLWYIRIATTDIVYSDYIRIVNKYLPDVWAPENFFRPDVLTRIPINYLERPLNVALFHYSTTFEMALGAVGLWLSAIVLGRYAQKKEIGLLWFVFLMFITFSLDKWEMLTNGTGWVHFLAFACFYFHYLVFDHVLYGAAKPWEKKLLIVLPAIITLGIAGPYCAVYSVVMVLAYLSVMAAGVHRKKTVGQNDLSMDWQFCVIGIVSVVIPLLLYMWSDSYAIEDHDGAIKVGLVEMLLEQPLFFPQFLIKSMASMVVGEETLEEMIANGTFTETVEYVLGILLGCGYLLALFLNVRHRLYEKTLLPLMLLFSGMGNHAIVLVGRYIFARTNYGMSSRYALQYQAGLLGIVVTFALVWKLRARGGAKSAAAVSERGADVPEKQPVSAGLVTRVLAIVFCAMILAGHGYTNYRELQKAPYREAYGENIANAALQYEILSDDEIRETFDYRKGRKESAADVRRALRILKENHWNIFSKVEY